MNDLGRLKCVICFSIMVEPTQAICGCRFCLACIQDFQNGNCKGCGVFFDKSPKLIKDVAVKKEIMNLKIPCPNEGCNIILLHGNMESHLKVCEYRNERCKQCHKEYVLSEMNEHLSMFCSLATVNCRYCNTSMTREYLLQVHNNVISENLCERMELECPYCCFGIVNLKKHFLKCANLPLKCSFNELGCHYSGSRDAMNMHLNEENHLQLLVSSITSLRIENAELRAKCIKSDESMISECQRLSETNLKLEETVRELSGKIEDLVKHTTSMDSKIMMFTNKSSDCDIFTCKSLIKVMNL